MPHIFLFLQAVFAHWVGLLGIALTLAPLVPQRFEQWIERKIVKTQFSFKHLWIVGAFLLVIAFYQGWNDEHNNAEEAMYGKDGKSEAWSKYNECDKERAVKTALADTYSQSVVNQQNLLNGQQDTFNRCVLSLAKEAAPESLQVDVMRWQIDETYHFANVGEVEFWVLVAIPNKIVSPLRGTVKCDAPFVAARSTLLTHGNAIRADYEQVTPQSAHIEFLYPPWSDKNPLVFFVYTTKGKAINSCSFVRD